MHFISQVLIAANAWGAGLPHAPKEDATNLSLNAPAESPIRPLLDAPTAIQDEYDKLRNELSQDERYEEVFELLQQLEDTVNRLNNKLALPKLPGDCTDGQPAVVKDACALLEILDSEKMLWKERIELYGADIDAT